MDTFYINMDIKDSTILWRCNELEMVEAFAKEWYIISEWVRYINDIPLKNNVSIQVAGQFGDEWRMIFTGSETQLKMLVQELLSALLQYVDVPFYNSVKNKSLVSCKTNETRKTRNKTLFRIGISKGVDASTKQGDIKRAVDIEANCTIDKVCIEKNIFKLKELPVSKGRAFQEMLDVKSLLKTTGSKSNFTKLNVFYVFTLEGKTLVSTKTIPVKVKTNAKMGKTMKSYIFENIDEYVAFIKKCKGKDVLYSNAYGPVYRPKKNSKLFFLHAHDVYGDVVNTAAKVLFKL